MRKQLGEVGLGNFGIEIKFPNFPISKFQNN